jgi:eukaryotic-like serine/threonine-protein kinase
MGATDEADLATPRISPDGRRTAVSRNVQGNLDIWVLDGTRTNRFTFDPANERFPTWSPDGNRMVFNSNRKGTQNLYIKASSGVGSDELLLESPQLKQPSDWSSDGRFLLYQSSDPQTAQDLWVLPLEGNRKPWVFLKTNFAELEGQFSPDGRWVAYVSGESGREEVYVRPFVEAAGSAAGQTGGQWQVSTAGGISPRWRPGRQGTVLYRTGRPNDGRANHGHEGRAGSRRADGAL